MSERDLIAVLFLCMPLVLCAGVWLGLRLGYEQEKMRREATCKHLLRQGSLNMSMRGPHDPVGVALWNAGTYVMEGPEGPDRVP